MFTIGGGGGLALGNLETQLKIDNKNFQWIFVFFDGNLMDFLVFD